MIFGALANGYCGIYYIRYHRNSGLTTRLMIILISNDILSCISYIWFAIVNIENLDNTYSNFVYSFIASNSGWITLLMAALRCILTISPLYVINQKGFYAAPIGGTIINFIIIIVPYIKFIESQDGEYVKVCCIYYSLIMIAIIVFSVILTVTLWYKGQKRISRVARKASATVAIIALIYIATTLPIIIAIIKWDPKWMVFVLSLCAPVSGSLNPIVYITRKKQLQTFCCNLQKTHATAGRTSSNNS